MEACSSNTSSSEFSSVPVFTGRLTVQKQTNWANGRLDGGVEGHCTLSGSLDEKGHQQKYQQIQTQSRSSSVEPP